jgi:hypothetical protein
MLRKEFPVALLSELEFVFVRCLDMGSIPSVCRSKCIVCLALVVRRRGDLVSSLLILKLCARCGLPLNWIIYRSVS